MKKTEVLEVAYCDFCDSEHRQEARYVCWWCERDVCNIHYNQVQGSFSHREASQRYDACPECEKEFKRLVCEVIVKMKRV